MASHHDDDTMPEETQGYKLSQPKQSLAEYKNMGMMPHITVFRGFYEELQSLHLLPLLALIQASCFV